MKYRDLGAHYQVSLSEAEVEAWARKWPCFGRTQPMWFEFCKRHGDLTDSKRHSFDESAALAMSKDAQRWAEDNHLNKETT